MLGTSKIDTMKCLILLYYTISFSALRQACVLFNEMALTSLVFKNFIGTSSHLERRHMNYLTLMEERLFKTVGNEVEVF